MIADEVERGVVDCRDQAQAHERVNDVSLNQKVGESRQRERAKRKDDVRHADHGGQD